MLLTFTTLLLAAIATLLPLPVAANEIDNNNPAIADPSLVGTTPCIDEEPSNNLINNSPHIADPSMVQATLPTTENDGEPLSNSVDAQNIIDSGGISPLTFEDDTEGVLVLIVPTTASMDGNLLDTSDSHANEAIDQIGEMVIETPLDGSVSAESTSENDAAADPNDAPGIDDPSKIIGDDYVGEMVVIAPGHTIESLVVAGDNSADTLGAPTAPQTNDYIGEMVIVESDDTTRSSTESDDAISVTTLAEVITSIFLPLVNQ